MNAPKPNAAQRALERYTAEQALASEDRKRALRSEHPGYYAERRLAEADTWGHAAQILREEIAADEKDQEGKAHAKL